jgi:hypothetical protein
MTFDELHKKCEALVAELASDIAQVPADRFAAVLLDAEHLVIMSMPQADLPSYLAKVGLSPTVDLDTPPDAPTKIYRIVVVVLAENVEHPLHGSNVLASDAMLCGLRRADPTTIN